jgi:cytochrome c biogenesis protein CcmG/thiol:disulfide interchange protein DsbE
MWPRLSILAGLMAGIAAAALVIGGILAFAPEPGAAVTPPPQPSASLTVLASVTPSPAPSTSASPSSGASPAGSPGASASGSTAQFHVGETAPALHVPKVGGGTIDLATLRGKPVWINFMGTYCPPCVDEFPLMNGYATRYANTGLVVIAVDVKEDEGTVAAFVEQLNTTFPLGLDADASAAARWDAVALPVHFWIDKDGVIRNGALGGIGADVMAAGLRTILPGVEVTP